MIDSVHPSGQVQELEGIIAEKDALLKKSFELISSWEAKFAAYKKTHDPLLFKSKPARDFEL